MEALGAAALVTVSVAAVAWIMLRKLGIGQRGGKADCGCGQCATKGRKHQQ